MVGFAGLAGPVGCDGLAGPVGCDGLKVPRSLHWGELI